MNMPGPKQQQVSKWASVRLERGADKGTEAGWQLVVVDGWEGGEAVRMAGGVEGSGDGGRCGSVHRMNPRGCCLPLFSRWRVCPKDRSTEERSAAIVPFDRPTEIHSRVRTISSPQPPPPRGARLAQRNIDATGGHRHDPRNHRFIASTCALSPPHCPPLTSLRSCAYKDRKARLYKMTQMSKLEMNFAYDNLDYGLYYL